MAKFEDNLTRAESGALASQGVSQRLSGEAFTAQKGIGADLGKSAAGKTQNSLPELILEKSEETPKAKLDNPLSTQAKRDQLIDAPKEKTESEGPGLEKPMDCGIDPILDSNTGEGVEASQDTKEALDNYDTTPVEQDAELEEVATDTELESKDESENEAKEEEEEEVRDDDKIEV